MSSSSSLQSATSSSSPVNLNGVPVTNGVENKAQPITRFNILFEHPLSKAEFLSTTINSLGILSEDELTDTNSQIEESLIALQCVPRANKSGMEATIFNHKITILCSEYRRLERELAEAQQKVQQPTTSLELEELKGQISKLQAQIITAETLSTDFQKSAEKAKLQFETLQKEKAQLQRESNEYRANKEAELIAANKQITSLKKDGAELVETKKQIISLKKELEAKKDLTTPDELKKITQSFEKQISELNGKLAKLKESAEKLGKDVKSRDATIKDLEQKIQQQSSELKKKQERLKETQKNQKSEADVKELQNELADLKEKLKASEEKHQSAVQQFQRIQDLFQQLGTNIQEAFKTHQTQLPLSTSSSSTGKAAPALKSSSSKRKISTDRSEESKEPEKRDVTSNKKARHSRRIEEPDVEYDLSSDGVVSETDDEREDEEVLESKDRTKQANISTTSSSSKPQTRSEKQTNGSNNMRSKLRSSTKDTPNSHSQAAASFERSAKLKATEKMEQQSIIDLDSYYDKEIKKLKKRDELYRQQHLDDVARIDELQNEKEQLQKENDKLSAKIKKLEAQLSQKGK